MELLIFIILAVDAAGLLYLAAAPNGDANRLERARIVEEKSAEEWSRRRAESTDG